jgi:hypothetical protein
MKNLLSTYLFACLIALSPSLSYAQETPAQSIGVAKIAIEKAINAGADKDAPDDLSSAKLWLSEAEKSNSIVNNLLTMVVPEDIKKSRNEETIYLAGMAKIKAQTAEAKAKRQSAITAYQKVQKDLDGFLGALTLAKNRQDEVNKLKSELEKANAALKESTPK